MSEHSDEKIEQMDEFELSLQRAMRRVEARAELSAKVLAVAAEAEEHRRQPGGWWMKPSTGGRILVMPKPAMRVWGAGAIAAALIVGVLGVAELHERREQRVMVAQQRVQAQREFETATQITDRALDRVRQQMERAGVKPED